MAADSEWMDLSFGGASQLVADPATTAPHRDRVAAQAQASLRQGLPGVEFVPGQAPGGTGIPTVAPDAASQDGWEEIKYDTVAPTAPVAEPAPAEDPSAWRQFFGRLVAGGREGFGSLRDAVDRAAVANPTFIGDHPMDPLVAQVDAGRYRQEFEANRPAIETRLKKDLQGRAESRKAFSDVLAPELGEDAGWLDRTARGVGGSVGYMAPALAAGLLTGGTAPTAAAANAARAGAWNAFKSGTIRSLKEPAAYVAATLMGTQTYNDSKTRFEKEGLDDSQASQLALADAAAEVVFEIPAFGALFGKGRTFIKRALVTALADVPGEIATSVIQNTTEALSKYGSKPTDEQAAAAWDAGVQATLAQAGDTASVAAVQSLLLAGLGGGLRNPDRQSKPAAPRRKPAAPPAAAPPAPAAAPPPSGAVAPPTAAAPPAPAGAAPATKRVAMYSPPEANGNQTPVQVESISGEYATVTSLDEEGNPLIVNDEPATYQVPVSTLIGPGFSPAPPAAAGAPAAAAPPVSSSAAAAAPPAAQTSTAAPNAPASPGGVVDAPTPEPVRDVQAQIDDMLDPATPRQGVFLSKANVDSLKSIKQLESLIAGRPVAKNWDFKGGIMVFPTPEARDAAVAANESLKADPQKGVKRQQLTGRITGSAVVSDTKPAVGVAVQAKTPDGAVVRETLAAPNQVSNAATVLAAEQPGTTVTIASPDQVQADRAAGVAADQAAAKKPAKPKVLTPRQQVEAAVKMVREMETPEEGRKNADSITQRAQNAVAFAKGIKATLELVGKKIPPDTLKEARTAVSAILNESWAKDDADVALRDKGGGTGEQSKLEKGWGVTHARITERVNDLVAAAERVAAELPATITKKESKPAEAKPAAQPEAAPAPTPAPAAPVEAVAAPDGPGGDTGVAPSTESAPVSSSVVPAAPTAAPGARKKRVAVKGLKPAGKTAEQIAEEQAAAAAADAEARPLLEVKPRKIVGAELKQLLEGELGLDPETIQGGGLADRVRDMLPDFNKEDSWISYLASLKSLFADNPTLKTQIRTLGNEFVEADEADLQAVTGKVVDALQDIDGKRLPPKAIDAVIDYMRYLRSFNKLRDAVQEVDEDAEIREIMGAETRLDRRDGMSTDRSMESIGEALTNNTPQTMTKKLQRMFTTGGHVFAADGALAKLLDQFYNKNTDASLHEILDGWLQRVDQYEDSDLDYLTTFVRQLRRRVPDVPVRFGSTIENLGKFKQTSADSTRQPMGLFDNRSNTIQVRVADGDRNPTETFRTLLHEAVHAATAYELLARPNSAASQQLKDAYKKVLLMATEKFGLDPVMGSVAYASGESSTKPEVYIDGLYGLTNELEFVTEMFTNPKFQQFILSLGEGKQSNKTILRQLLDQIVNAIYKALDLKNPSHGWLLRESMAAGLNTMDAQVMSAIKHTGQLETLITELSKVHPQLSREDIKRRLVSGMSTSRPQYTSLVYSAGAKTIAGAVPSGPRDVQRAMASYGDPGAEGDIRNEDTIRGLAGDLATRAVKKTKGFMKSQTAERLRRGFLSTYTFDQLERRMSRFFGGTAEAMNPLTRMMDVRRRKQTAANQLLERAQERVNSEWLKLSNAESKQLGRMMIDSTLWQIDPRKPKNQQLPKVQKRKGFDARYDKLLQQWEQMDSRQQDIYSEALKYNEYSFNKLRRAAVDMALDGYTTKEISTAERSLIYTAKTYEDLQKLVGQGKMIDLGENNDGFLRTMKDVMKVTSINGPYFTLRRHGNLVVQAEKDGERAFTTEQDAESFAERITDMTPKNKAKVMQRGGKWVVDYKIDYVSFHKSRAEAEAEVDQLEKMGVTAKAVTYKNQAVAGTALTPALKELVSKASKRLPGKDTDKGRQAIVHAMENAFATILAERAAIGSQLKRENVAGAKPEEMHIGFAERSHAFAWHYANLATAKEETRTLSRLREYSREPELGNADQATMYQRGQVVEEVERRLAQEAEDFGVSGPLDAALAKVGFATYLATPSYAFVNSMQNFTIAIPVIGARFGYGRTARAFGRSMAAISGPAFSKAIRGLASRPGRLTSYDVYKAVAVAVADNPKLSKWAEGPNSPLQQLVDLGVINASFTQELVDVAQGKSLTMQKTLEWMRLLPQAAEMMNRVSSSLALLELTNGNVQKTADLVRLTQIDYSSQNRPRAFKAFDRVAGGRALLMFKMYPQAMYHLVVSSMHDAVSGGEMTRAQATKTLGGIVLSHTLAAGVLGGVMIEPLRMLMNAIALGGDDDEPWDIDTGIRTWLAKTFNDTWLARVASKGLPNAVGVDLSDRMGLAHLFFWETPDWSDRDSIFQWIGKQTGPVASFLAQGVSGAINAYKRGDFGQALSQLVPIKMVRDTAGAIELATKGMRTQTGNTVLGPEEFNAMEVAAKFLGFNPADAADQSDKNQTRFGYRRWLDKRKGEILSQVRNATTEAERIEAFKAVRVFNEKNPGAAITSQSIAQSRRASLQQAAEARGERVKDPNLRERLAY